MLLWLLSFAAIVIVIVDWQALIFHSPLLCRAACVHNILRYTNEVKQNIVTCHLILKAFGRREESHEIADITAFWCYREKPYLYHQAGLIITALPPQLCLRWSQQFGHPIQPEINPDIF